MKYLMMLIFLLLANISLPQNRDSTVYTQLSPFYIDLGTLTIDEGIINVCADDTVFVSHVFLQDTISFYSDTVTVADTVCIPVYVDLDDSVIVPDTIPPLGDWYGIMYNENSAQWTVPGDFSTPNSINYSVIGVMDTIFLTGSYSGTWTLRSVDNVVFLFKDFTLTGGSGKGIDAQYCDNIEFHVVDSDPSNFKILNYDGKHFSAKSMENLFVDGAYIRTPTSAGQTDGFYIDKTMGLKIVNSDIIIFNGASSPHCDIIQMYKVGGTVIIANNTGVQDNNKTSNNQGIYATTPQAGAYFYLNNNISGKGAKKIKNLLTLRRLPSLGGIDVPITITGNTLTTDGYHLIWLTGITNYIIEDNTFSGSYVGNAITIQ